jgi:hypothetical protein
MEVSGPFTFASTARGLVAVAKAMDSGGYHVFELDEQGSLLAPARLLWSTSSAVAAPRIAVSDGVIAVGDRAIDVVSGHQICRLALSGLQGSVPDRAPTRFSDAPDLESIRNGVQMCDVVSLDHGFLLVWQQYVSRTSGDSTMFAQRVGLDGRPEGDRLILREGLQKPIMEGQVASIGDRVAVALPGENDSDASLVLIEDGVARSVRFDFGAGPPPSATVTLQPAHDGFVAVANGSVAWLDRNGNRRAGPMLIGERAGVAALDSGFVVVSHDEFLVATTVDSRFGSRSEPLGLSDDRTASSMALVGGYRGSAPFIVYSEEGRVRVGKLGCSQESAARPGPSGCPTGMPPAPIPDLCSDPVCHVGIRLDYATLGVKGWTVSSGPAHAIDAAQARDVALRAFTMHRVASDVVITGPSAGIYLAYASPSDVGAVALVSALSGQIVVAGGVVFGGQGSLWIPSTWRSASELVCGDTPVHPAELDDPASTPCPREDGLEFPTASDAVEVALRTNVAMQLSSRARVSASVHLYTPSAATCDTRSFEYLVVLTQQRL